MSVKRVMAWAALILLILAWRRAALWQSLGLLSAFCVLLLITALRGIDISCGCYGEWLETGIPLALPGSASSPGAAGGSVDAAGGAVGSEDGVERRWDRKGGRRGPAQPVTPAFEFEDLISRI